MCRVCIDSGREVFQGGMDEVKGALALGDRVRAIVERCGRQLDAQLAAVDDVGDPPGSRLGGGESGCGGGVSHGDLL
jgi:hypothetical protein